MPQRTQALIVVVVLAALLGMPWLERPFHTRGEPREALVAQAMLTTGNWISPPSYDGAVPSKPPFSHWLIALASLPQGEVTEASSRLPSALAVVIFAAAFFSVVARRVSDSAALGASLILLSSSEWFRSASTCRVDTILATSMAGAMLALFMWWERGCRGVPIIAIGLAAISALTKGPIGIVLPLGVFGLFCWSKKGFALRAIPPIAVRCVAITVPVVAFVSLWYILGYRERGDAFLEKVMYENFDRFTSQMADEPHKHSVFYLLGMLLLGLLPWTILALAALVLRSGPRVPSRSAVAKWWSAQPDLYQFAVIAAGSVVLFFCVPSSKRSVYLLPAYPFIALILERALRVWIHDHARLARVLAGVVWSVAGLAVAVFGVLLIVTVPQISLDWEVFFRSLTAWKVISSGVLLFGLIVSLRAMAARGELSIAHRLAVAMVLAVWCVSFTVYDTIASQLSPKGWLASDGFRQRVAVGAGRPMYSFGSEMYGASFYLQERFSRLHSPPQSGAYVFVEQKRVDALKKEFGSNIREVSRYASGVESRSKSVVVFEFVDPSSLQ